MNVDNLNTLIAHLEAQPAERFDMSNTFTLPDGGPDDGAIPDINICGTAACIAGECHILIGTKVGIDYDDRDVDKWLGLEEWEGDLLFCPEGFEEKHRYPKYRAIATLKRLRDTYLATGQVVVDWGPEPSAGQPWSTPHVSEIIAPSLPAEITGLLRSVKVEA